MLHVVLDTHVDAFRLDLQFSAEAGKTTVLLGESGAGKSTVLRHIAGLCHPRRGRISLGTRTYFDSDRHLLIPPQDRPFGYVFQDYVLFPHLSVFENVAFGLRAQHLPRATIARWVAEALEQVHLVGFDRRLPCQLSGGQQQRVAIARALALHPQLLLLDEPLAALDVQTRREVRQQLYRLLAEIRLTTLLVTHQYLEACLFGHHILVLDHGRIIQQGDQRTLLQEPRSSYVAELVGTNFFRGRVVQRDALALCTIELAGSQEQSFYIQATIEQAGQSDLRVGEDAFVIVDPRSITLHPTLPQGSARNSVCGEIVQVLYLGGGRQGRRGEGESDPYRGAPWLSTAPTDDGRVRVSILLEAAKLPLTAEVTSLSASQMGLREGQTIYASFKATEARAYS
jgi:molybdate transport system ATP-binding protein